MLTQLQRRLSLRSVARVLLGVFASVAVLAAIGLLLIRFWLWPAVPQWQEEFLGDTRAKLAERGLALEVGPVVADWQTWYRPRLTVERLTLRDAQGQPLAELGNSQAIVGLSSLASIWRPAPVFSEIQIESPRVSARREATGEIVIAGFRLPADDRSPDAENKGLAWVLGQRKIQVTNGVFLWADLAKGKSTEIQSLNAEISNFGYRHAWSLSGKASAPIGDAFSMQGVFRHSLFKGATSISNWSGDAYVQFDRVDLSELSQFVQLSEQIPLKINSGTGAFKAWASLSEKRVQGLTVDLDLSNGSLQWGPSRRPLTFERLFGRVETTLAGDRQEVKVSDLNVQSTQLAEPIRVPSAELSLEQTSATGESRVRATSKAVNLAAARWLVSHLPIAPALKEHVESLSPTGTLKNVEFSWTERSDVPSAASLQAEFDELAVAAGPKRPGFAGLSGKVKADQSSGSISINSGKSSVIVPRVFEEPRLDFEKLAAELRWQVAPNNADAFAPLKVTILGLSASNAEIAVEASGSYVSVEQGLGDLDIKGRVVRASPAHIYRYVPLAAGSGTRAWLREALKDASPYRAEFELAGPLEKFPFADGKSGKFLAKVHVENAKLIPDAGWPAFTGINAQITFDRARFDLVAQQAQFAGLRSSTIHAHIADIEASQTLLQVKGVLKGDLQQFFAAANQSPVKGWLGGITENMSGKADSSLVLDLNLNLSDSKRSRYFGNLTLGRGSFSPSAKLPTIAMTSGSIEFNEFGLSALAIEGQALGGPVKASRQSVIGAPNKSRLLIEGRATGRGLEQWAQQAFELDWFGKLSGVTPYSVMLDIGGASTLATVITSLKGIDSKLAAPLEKAGAEEWPVQVQYRGASGEIIVSLDSPKAKGQLSWQPQDQSESLLRAKFSRIWLDSRKQPGEAEPSEADNTMVAHHWPRIDFVIDDFRVGPRQWGRLEAQAYPVFATRSWEISRLMISNPDGVLTGKGNWSTRALDPRSKRRSRTVLDVEFDIKNGGSLLARTGYPGVVRDTTGKISGQLNWPGSPLDFSGAALSGKTSLNLEKGRFLKAEPGVARLVGVLNLQTLPRRIKLDFSDVFSEGFTYERIRGDLEFLDGEVRTSNLRIVGVQASVLLEGSADIRNETQNLRLAVLPEVNAGLASLGYAALVNPAVGLGAFLAQYVLRDPVRKLLAYEYQVTGSWDDPVVTSIESRGRAEPPELTSPVK